jgi:PadR family transcriptional regulator, regulatory protein AphA
LEDIRLTPTSYIVLGLVADAGEVTPYDLKGLVAGSIGDMWSVQHTQLYAEPERLARAGYLTETREDSGRRRKLYTITPAGRTALDAWLTGEPTTEMPEIRDIGLLRIFFGADPGPIAAVQAAVHREKLRQYEELEKELDGSGLDGPLLVLRAGIGHEREWVRYWSGLAGG